MKDRKLLFFDIDGTLLSEKTHTVPQSAKEALKKAKENGHLIFINTGRPISTIDQEIHDLNPDGYICGCGTYITYHDQVIYHHQLSKERCKEIASLIKKYEIDAVLESKDHVYFNENIKNPFVREIKERYTNNGFNVSSSTDPNLSFDKFTIWFDHDISEFRKNILKDFDIIERSEEMLEIVPKGHSKATGIQTVADDFKSDLDHCYVFGDSFNDESMLRYVKHSIVMANGVQAMKDIAYFVTKDIEDDGIAYALEKLDLI